MITWEDLAAQLEQSFFGHPLREWTAAIASAALLFLTLKLVQSVVVGRLKRRPPHFAAETWELAGDALAGVRLWFLFIAAVFVGSLLLALPPKTTAILNTLATLAVLVQAALTGNRLLQFVIARYSRLRMESDAAGVTTVTTLGFLSQLGLWTVTTLLVLQNLGIDVSALVAGLGIGGIAVALAAQNILGDLFASLSIVLDKPFALGDAISLGEQSGTVERIGIKSTHLRSPSGEQLIISNSDLLKSRIRNYKRMQERRMAFHLGVTYHTPPEKLAAIPAMVREAVTSQEHVRFDRAHFTAFGGSSLDFEVVYFILFPDFNLSLDIQQKINLLLFQRFLAEGIEFAYPTRTVILERQAKEEVEKQL